MPFLEVVLVILSVVIVDVRVVWVFRVIVKVFDNVRVKREYPQVADDERFAI